MVANPRIVIDRLLSIPELFRIVRYHESDRTTDQSWRCGGQVFTFFL